MLEVYGINIFFSIDAPLLLKEYVLYTQLNIDNYGAKLTDMRPAKYSFNLLKKIFIKLMHNPPFPPISNVI